MNCIALVPWMFWKPCAFRPISQVHATSQVALVLGLLIRVQYVGIACMVEGDSLMRVYALCRVG